MPLPDTAGPSLFVVTDAQKTLHHGIDPVMSAVLGTASGRGGGGRRDGLASDVPSVPRAELYALAALAASGAVCFGSVLGALPSHAMPFTATACLFARPMASDRGWRVATARWNGDGGG